jgi:hypothetical protein
MQVFTATHPSALVIALPRFAPLPVPMVLHMLGETSDSFITGVQRTSDELKKRLETLEAQVQAARDYVYEQMAQRLAEQERLPMKWLQDALAHAVETKPLKRKGTSKTPREYSMSVRTMNNWRDNNILLPHEPRKINLDRAAALLVAALVDERKQGFVPNYIDPRSEEYWGWMQTEPEGPILPCPFPPPPSLPASTLYWSRWPSFNKSVKQFPGRGSLGFPSLDQTTLELWDPNLANSDIRRLILDDTTFFGRKMHAETLRDLAEALYYRLASTRLSPSVPQPNLPLLWPRDTWSSSHPSA